jgi:hypothetical protein
LGLTKLRTIGRQLGPNRAPSKKIGPEYRVNRVDPAGIRTHNGLRHPRLA